MVCGDDERPGGRRPADDNVFDSMRRFVDEQIASMLQGTIGLPSANSRQQERRWMEEPWDRDHRVQRGTEPTRNSALGSDRAGEPVYSLDAFYKNLGNLLPEWYRNRDYSLPTPDDAHFATYLVHSPYSPLHLQEDWRLLQARIPWGVAFEDLLKAEYGQTQPAGQERDPRWDTELELFSMPYIVRMVYHKWRGTESSPEHALQSLREGWTRDPLHDEPGWPFARSPPAMLPFGSLQENTTDGSHATEQDDGPETEQDIYERMLSHSDRFFPSSNAPQPDTTVTPTKPEVLSTMTTTERTILPDGTVNTKVVLKKTFADGRKESTESVHAGKPDQSMGYGHEAEVSRSDRREVAEEKPDTKKNGWFWSK